MMDRWLASPLAPRRSLAARVAAVSLLVLILLPFTAPFATCDPSSLDATHAQGQLTDKVGSDVLLTTTSAGQLRHVAGAVLPLPTHSNRERRRHPHDHRVLRV